MLSHIEACMCAEQDVHAKRVHIVPQYTTLEMYLAVLWSKRLLYTQIIHSLSTPHLRWHLYMCNTVYLVSRDCAWNTGRACVDSSLTFMPRSCAFCCHALAVGGRQAASESSIKTARSLTSCNTLLTDLRDLQRVHIAGLPSA